MDILEKLNKTFANWYESWFGDEFGDIRPKDVLRKIINEMERNRKEGLDGKVYVPNKYILEIIFANDEEREYLLTFLDKDDLDNALRKYMEENDYLLKGPLDFVIEEQNPSDELQKRDKITVKCRWDVRPTDREAEYADEDNLVVPGLVFEEDATDVFDDEDYTVAANDIYDTGTVSPAALEIKRTNGKTDVYMMRKPSITIGRSHKLGNGIIIDDDSMVSKQHARISMTSNGFRIVDLGSTNGVWVNDTLVDNAILHNGDMIRIGSTVIRFNNLGLADRRPATMDADMTAKPKLSTGSGPKGQDEYLLASDMVIGRSLGCDIRIDDSSVSRKHARIYRKDSQYYIEDLQSKNGTTVNNSPVNPGSPRQLNNGDRIQIGEVELTFEMDRPS